MSAVAEVRRSTAEVMKIAKHVSINTSAINKFADELLAAGADNVDWDASGWHYSRDAASGGPLTCQYIFVLDALNFCFWPTPEFEYEQLAVSLKTALEKDETVFDADKLMSLTEEKLASWFAPFVLPQLDERVRKLREVTVV